MSEACDLYDIHKDEDTTKLKMWSPPKERPQAPLHMYGDDKSKTPLKFSGVSENDISAEDIFKQFIQQTPQPVEGLEAVLLGPGGEEIYRGEDIVRVKNPDYRILTGRMDGDLGGIVMLSPMHIFAAQKRPPDPVLIISKIYINYCGRRIRMFSLKGEEIMLRGMPIPSDDYTLTFR